MKSRHAMLGVLAGAVSLGFAARPSDVVINLGDDPSYGGDWPTTPTRAAEPAGKQPNPEKERQAAERRARKLAKQAKGFVA